MPIQCLQCDALNKDTAEFCSECGTSLVLIPEHTKVTRADQKPATVPVNNGARFVAASRPPETLPEASVQTPKAKPVKPPRRRRTWFRYFVFAFGVATVGYFFGMIIEPEFQDTWLTMATLFGFAALVIGFPIALRRSRRTSMEETTVEGIGQGQTYPIALRRSRRTSMGVVTHLREWHPRDKHEYKIIPNWLFDLRPTDKHWRPLKDQKGFLLPIVEVEFRADRLHGPPLEEGSRVIMRGKRRHRIFEAKEIWNVSPDSIMPVYGEKKCFWGRAISLQKSQDQDMRYPGQRYLEVLNFRLQQTDKDFQAVLRDGQDSLLPALPVEIRAQMISDVLQENDKVEVRGQIVGGTLYTNEVYIHSAGGAALVVKEWAGIP